MAEIVSQTTLRPSESLRLTGEVAAEEYLAECDGDTWNLAGIARGLDVFRKVYLARMIFGVTSLACRWGERVWNVFAEPIHVMDRGFKAGRSAEQVGFETALACIDSFRAFQSLDQPDWQTSVEMFVGGMQLLEQLLTLKAKVYYGIKDGTYAQQNPARVFDEVLSPLVTGNLMWLGGEGLVGIVAGPARVAADTALLPSSRYPIVYRTEGVIGASFGGRSPSVISPVAPNPLEAAAYAGEAFEAGAAELVAGPQYFVEGNLVRVALPESANAFVSPPTVGGTGALQAMLGLAGGVQLLLDDETSGDLDERARRILRDGLSIDLGGRSLIDVARKLVEEADLAMRLAVLRACARQLRAMGMYAQASLIEQEMADLLGSFEAKWGGVPASGPVASASGARGVSGASGVPAVLRTRRKKADSAKDRAAKFERALTILENLANQLQEDRVESPAFFYVQGMEALGVIAQAFHQGDISLNEDQANQFLQTLAPVLREIKKLGLDHYTDHGFDPSLAEERLRDMLIARTRAVIVIDRLMASIAQKKHPIDARKFAELPPKLRTITQAVILALNEYRSSQSMITRDALETELNAAQTNTAVAAIQAASRNPSQLRNFLISFLPGIFCTNIAQDFSGMNKVNTTAATRLKTTELYLLRIFVSSDQRPEEFIADPRLVDRLMRSAEETPMGIVTTVNSTTFSVQTDGLDRIQLFLGNSETLVTEVLERLVIERDRLLQGRPGKQGLSGEDRRRFLFLENLTDGFMLTDDGLVFFPTASASDSVLPEIPFSRIYRPLYGGYVEYQGAEDLPRGTYNLSAVEKAVAWVRDVAYNLSEQHFASVKQGSEETSLPVLVGLGDVVLPSEFSRLTWRLGRPPSDDETFQALMRTAGRRAETGWDGPDRRQKSRTFRFLTDDDLRAVLPVVAQQLIGRKKESVTGESDADAIAEAWLEVLHSDTIHSADPIPYEIVRAVQLAFREPVTDSRLVALYREAGGLVEPHRLARDLEGIIGRVEQMAQTFKDDPPVWVDGQEESRTNFDRLIQDFAAKYSQFLELAYHPRDRVTRNWDYLGAWAVLKMTEYFDKYNVPQDKRIVFVITTELMGGRELDAQVNPPRPDHLMDPNMGPLRRVGHKVGKGIYGTNPDTSLPFDYPDEMVGVEIGDEGGRVNPGVDREMNPVTPLQLAGETRKVVEEMFPGDVHYHGKVTLGPRTERLPLWELSSQAIVRGETPITIAALGTADGPMLEGAWIYVEGAEEEPQKYEVPAGMKPHDFKKVMGPIGVRIVGQEFTLSELTPDLVLRAVAVGMEADKTVKKMPNPTSGVFILRPDGSLEHILPEGQP